VAGIFIDPGELFDIDFPEDGVVIQIRRLGVDEQAKLGKKHTRIIQGRTGRQEDLNFEPYRHEALEKGIDSWRGVRDEHEKEIPFSPNLISSLRPAVQDKLFAAIFDREEELLGKFVSQPIDSVRLKEARPALVVENAVG